MFRWRRKTRHAEQSRREVDVGEEQIGDGARLDLARPAQNARNANRLLPRLALEPQALRAEHVAVVGSEQDDGVVAQTEIVEGAHELADRIVDRRHHAVVLGDLSRSRGPGRRPPVRSHRQLHRIVEARVLRRRFVRDRAVVPIEWSGRRGAYRRAPREEFDAEVGEALGFELIQADRFGRIAEESVLEMLVAALVGGPELEALTAFARRYKSRQTRAAVEVPLTHEAGAVAGAPQFRARDTEFSRSRRSLATIPLRWVYWPVSRTARAGQQTGVLAKVRRSRMPSPAQPVDVRRVDILVAVTADRLRAQLVRHQKQDIRTACGGRRPRRRQGTRAAFGPEPSGVDGGAGEGFILFQAIVDPEAGRSHAQGGSTERF